MKKMQIILLAAALLLSACSKIEAPKADASVLVSTTFLADMTRKVAGERISVDTLLPAGTDPHSYQPAPQDIAKIEKSKLLIINGAEYEHFLEPLIENNGDEKIIVEAAANIELRKDAGGEHGVDPHAWLDPNLAIQYVENIRAALTAYDPDGADVYAQNAKLYTAHLKELDAWITQQVDLIPKEKRVLVTNHESLNYFAARYGFEVAGAVVPSFSSNAAPSAQQMAELVDQIRQANVPAIFLDAADNDTLAQQIAAETQVKVVSDLHLESLTEGAPAPTYIEMMKHNVTQIVEALK